MCNQLVGWVELVILHHRQHDPKINDEPQVVRILNHGYSRLSSGLESVCVETPKDLTSNPNQHHGQKKSKPH